MITITLMLTILTAVTFLRPASTPEAPAVGA